MPGSAIPASAALGPAQQPSNKAKDKHSFALRKFINMIGLLEISGSDALALNRRTEKHVVRDHLKAANFEESMLPPASFSF